MASEMKSNMRSRVAEILSEVSSGLPVQDIENIQELLDQNESALAISTLVSQLYEYEIPVAEQFLEEIFLVYSELGLPDREWVTLKEAAAETPTLGQGSSDSGREAVMSEQAPAASLSELIHLLEEQGGDPDTACRTSVELGFSELEAITALRRVFGLSLPDAKHIYDYATK